MIKVEVNGNDISTVMEGQVKELRNDVVMVCSNLIGNYIGAACKEGQEEKLLGILLSVIAARVVMEVE